MLKRRRTWWLQGCPGAGVAIALLVLLGVEALLHSDWLMHRLRSVFAAGRAFDKVLYVEQQPPRLLILGNSRIDNGIDPVTLADRIQPGMAGFNLGLPGANSTTLLGIVKRLDERGHFGPGRVERVLVGLDEGLLQGGDSLGYEIFFADKTLKESGLIGYLRTHVHLWGYADNLKQLREPAKLIQFGRALLGPIEPTGGGAAERLGYRPGFSAANQDAEQVERQEAGSTAPPDGTVVADFWVMVQLLQQRGVSVAVIFPPLLTRSVLYITDDRPEAAPYRRIRNELAARGVPMFALESDVRMQASEFVNAGHLNDAGAQRFSAMLGEALSARNESMRMRISAK